MSESGDRDLDRQIAQMLGDTREADDWWLSADGVRWRHEDGGPRLYSSDWNCIKPVVSYLRDRGAMLRVNLGLDTYGARFWRDWETGAISGGAFSVIDYDPDLARAVCKAAVRANERLQTDP